MKKLTHFVTFLIVLFFLGSCSSQGKLKTYTFVQDTEEGFVSVYTFTVEGDRVLKQTTDHTIDLNKIFESQGIAIESLSNEELTVEYEKAERMLNEAIAADPKVEGYSDTLTRKKHVMTEKVLIDYKKADLSQLKDIIWFAGSTEDKNFVSWKKTKELIEKQGFKEN